MVPIILLLSLFTACAPMKLEVGQATPIIVEHRVTVDVLTNYFRLLCAEELPQNATPAEITTCENAKLADFFTKTGSSTP